MPQIHEDTKSNKEFPWIIMLLILVCGSNITISQTRYWEYLTESERNEFLENTHVNPIAIDYFNGKFRVSDDSLTSELLDTLTGNKDFNPFYFYLFNKISMSADGAPAEVIPAYSYLLFRSHPVEVIGYFTLERMQRSDFEKIDRYAKIFGWEFKNIGFIDEENKVSFNDFKKLLRGKLADADMEDVKTLDTFLSEIGKVIESK